MATLVALAIVLCFLLAGGIALAVCVERPDVRAARALPLEDAPARGDDR